MPEPAGPARGGADRGATPGVRARDPAAQSSALPPIFQVNSRNTVRPALSNHEVS